MFAHRYFAGRFYAPFYYPPVEVVTPDDGFVILGGGAKESPYRDYKRRDIVREIFEEREALERAERDLAAKEKTAELARADGLKTRQVKKLEKDLHLLRAETMRLQSELQALVAMKERIDRENDDALLVLAMSVPFIQLKL